MMQYYDELEPIFGDRSNWTIAHVLEHQANVQPNSVCLVAPEESASWTYSQVLATAKRVGSGILESGAVRGDRVLIMAKNSSQFVHSWLGCGRAGLVEVPVNTAYTGEFLRHQLVTSDCRWAVIDDALATQFSQPVVANDARRIEKFWVIDTGGIGEAIRTLRDNGWAADPWENLLLADPVEFSPPEPRELASIFFTSGTTGPSKGVAMPHSQMHFFGEEVVSLTRLARSDVYLTVTPLFHGNAQFMAAYPAFIAGAALVVRSRFSASQWANQLRADSITVTNLLGVMMDFIWKQPTRPDDANNSLRCVFAAPTASSILSRFKERFGIEAFVEVFGLTETSAPILSPYEENRPPGAAGRQVRKWFDIQLVDPETDEEVPVGSVGELVVRPKVPGICSLGYYGMPGKTVEAWRNLWFHTGDALRRDHGGWYYFVDRYKDALRRRGENISSYEIEQAFLEHPSILEVAVIAVEAEVEAGEDEVMAVIVPSDSIDPDELWRWCQDRIPGFAIPRFLRFVEALPKTPSEKVQKAQLRVQGITSDSFDRIIQAETATSR